MVFYEGIFVIQAQTDIESRNIYDPVFILRMSLHGLSMDYIEPVEFASLGLLGVAFVSLSSPDDEMRKLGYKVLAVFRNVLEVSNACYYYSSFFVCSFLLM